jgi:hypothetical protein
VLILSEEIIYAIANCGQRGNFEIVWWSTRAGCDEEVACTLKLFFITWGRCLFWLADYIARTCHVLQR